MQAGVLIPDNYDIPLYDARTGHGYQRPLQEARVNELVNDGFANCHSLEPSQQGSEERDDLRARQARLHRLLHSNWRTATRSSFSLSRAMLSRC